MPVHPVFEYFNNFIGAAKELSKVPALVLPQYKDAARGLYDISQKLLAANENLARWLHRFRYFDFRQPNARSEFLRALADYSTMKAGPEFRQLKFSCGDIWQIYQRDIASKLGTWLVDQSKLQQAERAFGALGHADGNMVEFIHTEVIARLDAFLAAAEHSVDTGLLDDAERARQQFKADSKDLAEHIEAFSGELSDLVIQFAGMAKVPITLGH